MKNKLVVHVVDDDEAVLLSVKALLGQHGYEVLCYPLASDFLAEADLRGPGCVVTDVQMPGINGIQLQQQLIDLNSPFAVVVVTGVADVPMAVKMMARGAITLLEKPYSPIGLLHAVESGISASKAKWDQAQQKHSVQARVARLSGEEYRVMQYMLTDKPNKAIAQGMDLSMRTVDRRRRSVLNKMEVKSVPELAAILAASENLGGKTNVRPQFAGP